MLSSQCRVPNLIFKISFLIWKSFAIKTPRKQMMLIVEVHKKRSQIVLISY